MQLLDRYLNAVRFWLPSAQQDDIIAELGDDLRAEISDRESDLGRPLNEAELTAIIKRRGDPVLVAGNYLDHQPLIGPAFLPVYWFIVKLVTLWVLIPVFLLIVGPIEMAEMKNPAAAWGFSVWNLLMGQVFAFGVITLVFIILERSGVAQSAFGKTSADWDPRNLPALPVAHARNANAVPRSTAIAEIATGIILALTWLALFWGPEQIDAQIVRISKDLVHFSAAPIWTWVRWPLLAIALTNIGLGWLGLIRPYSLRIREWYRLGIDFSNLVVIGVLLLAGEWLILHSTVLAPEELAEASRWANFGIRITLGIAALGTGYTLIRRIVQLNARTAPRLNPSPTSHV